MDDLGVNGIADLKHEKPPTGLHFCPRALRALGQKWRPLGGFSCLRSAIPFTPTSPMQKLPIEQLYSESTFEFFYILLKYALVLHMHSALKMGKIVQYIVQTLANNVKNHCNKIFSALCFVAPPYKVNEIRTSCH